MPNERVFDMLKTSYSHLENMAEIKRKFEERLSQLQEGQEQAQSGESSGEANFRSVMSQGVETIPFSDDKFYRVTTTSEINHINRTGKLSSPEISMFDMSILKKFHDKLGMSYDELNELNSTREGQEKLRKLWSENKLGPLVPRLKSNHGDIGFQKGNTYYKVDNADNGTVVIASKNNVPKFLKGHHGTYSDRFNDDINVGEAVVLRDGFDASNFEYWVKQEDGWHRFDFGNEGNVNFAIIGKKGAAELDAAEEATLRMDNLYVAREMEKAGKDPKTIRLATGWERGADGKWRYEIEDIKEFNRYGNLGERRRNKDFARYYELVNKWFDEPKYNGSPLTEAELEEYEVLSEKYEEFSQRNNPNARTLGDYVDAPELFKAYPELMDIKMSIMPLHNALAEYGREIDDHGKGIDVIRLNSNVINSNRHPQEIQSILIHEIQHAIQSIEGFAKGGNLELADIIREEIQNKAKAWMWRNNLIETAKEHPELAGTIQLQHIAEREYREYIEGIGGEMPSQDIIDTGFNLYVRGYDNEGYENAFNQYAKGMSIFDNKEEVYRRFAGEVESRNVQDRMKMTPQERRATLLSETEDVSRDDQIFIEKSLFSAMGSREDNKMERIGEFFKDANLSEAEQAVVDVFSGERNNLPINVSRNDGDIRIIMRQGNATRGGTKHSIYRHLGSSVGYITEGDITLIPQILEKGTKRKVGKKGFEYKLDIDGTKYTVYTEENANREDFCDFYSNRKGDNVSSSNTQLSARAHSVTTNSIDKGTNKSDNSKTLLEKLQEETKEFTIGDNEATQTLNSKQKTGKVYDITPVDESEGSQSLEKIDVYP